MTICARGLSCDPKSSVPDARHASSSLALYDGMDATLGPPVPASDPHMEQFNRMVQQYLTGLSNDFCALQFPQGISLIVNNIIADRTDDDGLAPTTIFHIQDEYVYDLFLFQRQDIARQMDVDMANVGLVSVHSFSSTHVCEADTRRTVYYGLKIK